jgi:hypothetical protein
VVPFLEEVQLCWHLMIVDLLINDVALTPLWTTNLSCYDLLLHAGMHYQRRSPRCSSCWTRTRAATSPWRSSSRGYVGCMDGMDMERAI